MTEPRKIHVFWHVWLHGKWRPIVAEQIVLLRASGLYDAADSITVSVCGSLSEQALFEEFLKAARKVVIGNRGTDPLKYEFPALQMAWDQASSTPKGTSYDVCYFHSKGVRYENDQASQWRDILNHGVINRWQTHVKALNDGFAVSGQNYLPASKTYPSHFSGNFWWARSEHIASLPSPARLNQTDRYNAEWWVCFGKPKAFALPFVQHNL
jgi:hypothetical protein